MERLNTPKATRRYGNIETKNSSSGEEKTRSKRLRKSTREIVKHSTPVDNVTPNEVTAEISKILKSKSSSSDEAKRRKKKVRSVRFRTKGLESRKNIVDDDAWETEEEHEEQKSWWEAEKESPEKEFHKEDLQGPVREFATESAKRFRYKPKEFRRKKVAQGRKKDSYLISEETQNELFTSRGPGLFQTPEKIRREAIREERVFHSPTGSAHLSLRKIYREAVDDLVIREPKEVPPLNIYEEDEEDFHLKIPEVDVRKTYPVKILPSKVNYDFPVFCPTESNDFLWDEYVKEHKDDINERVHNLWSKTEKRKELANNYLKHPRGPGSRKKFFVSKNKPSPSSSANDLAKKDSMKNRSATRVMFEQSKETTRNATVYDLNTSKIYGDGTKVRLIVQNIERKHPKTRQRMNMVKPRTRAIGKKIRKDILECETEIRECKREIEYYENAMSSSEYKEPPWCTGHSFQDWSDVMMAFAGPEKSTHESEEKRILTEWSDENAEDTAKRITNISAISPVKKEAIPSYKNRGIQDNVLMESSSIPLYREEPEMGKLELSNQVGKVPTKSFSTSRNVLRDNQRNLKENQKNRENRSKRSLSAFHYSSTFSHGAQSEESVSPRKIRKIREMRKNILRMPAPSFSYISEQWKSPDSMPINNKENEGEETEESSPIFRSSLTYKKRKKSIINKDTTLNQKPRVKSNTPFHKRVKIVENMSY